MIPRAALALVVCAGGAFGAGEAHAEARRYAVVVGSNAGAADEVRLRYAEHDAAKIYEVLRDLGGFEPQDMVLLRGEDPETVRRTLIAMNDRIRTAAPPSSATLFVYYSGHADAEALHLGTRPLPLAELEQLVRGSPAAFRLLVLDACRSGALTRVKGGAPAPPLDVRVDDRPAGEGAVFLTSSSANEDAQESDELGGSFFTHYLVSGLLGAADADADGRVTLDEAYRHAYDSTLRASSRTLAGTQHPTFRFDLRGQGAVVITRPGAPAGQRAVLTLPSGQSYLVLADGSEGPVVAEVGAKDAVRRLSLRPGRYFLRGRTPDALLEGRVDLAPGARRDVRAGDLRRVEYARLVRKGGGDLHLLHGPLAGYRVRGALDGGRACQGLLVGYAWELARFTLMPRLGACRGGYENDFVEAASDEISLGLRLAHVWDLPGVSLEAAMHGGVGILRQGFATRGQAPARTTFAGLVGLAVGVSRDLPRGFYLLGEVGADTYVLRKSEDDGSTRLGPAFALATSLAAGKRW